MHAVRQDAREAPQELVAEIRGAERAVADPARRSSSVGVWCGDERREPIVSHGPAGHHLGRHEERGLECSVRPVNRELVWFLPIFLNFHQIKCFSIYIYI